MKNKNESITYSSNNVETIETQNKTNSNNMETIEKSKYEQMLSQYNTALNDSEIAAKVAEISEESVLAFTEKVNKFEDAYPELPHIATICVYPCFAKIVSQSLEVEGVEVACVSGSFPSSQALIEIKTVETALALKDGATEIDIVMSVGKYLSGDYETLCDEISELKAICGDRKMKVILETGLLPSASDIKKASLLAMYAGADYIKTSTGKEKPAATPEAAYVMCQAIKEYYDKTGIQIGFKPAGGLNTVHDALVYYTIVKEVLGEKWLTNQWLRLGTSRLANLLLSEVLGEETKFF